MSRTIVFKFVGKKALYTQLYRKRECVLRQGVLKYEPFKGWSGYFNTHTFCLTTTLLTHVVVCIRGAFHELQNSELGHLS